MMKKSLIFIVLLFCLSCSDEFRDTEKTAPIVVEGYVEANQLVKVFLTFPFSINDEIGEDNYKDFINSYAKVVVTTGSEREVLTFKKDEKLFPPYYYSSSLMTGKPGETYNLEVIYRGDTVTAETTVPSVQAEIDSLYCMEISGDTLHKSVLLSINRIAPDEVHYYKFFTRTQRQQTFYPIVFSTYSDETFGSKILVELSAGPENFMDTSTTTFYAVGDTVTVKVSVLDAIPGEFWRVYDNQQGYNNPFSNGSNLPSNIKGGLGVWTGMNSIQRQIIIK